MEKKNKSDKPADEALATISANQAS